MEKKLQGCIHALNHKLLHCNYNSKAHANIGANLDQIVTRLLKPPVFSKGPFGTICVPFRKTRASVAFFHLLVFFVYRSYSFVKKRQLSEGQARKPL